MTPAALGGFLNNIQTLWAVGLAGYIGLVSYDLSTFCTSDPPALPTITAADVAALFTVLDPIGHTLAVKKFQDYVGHFLWPTVCQCDNATVVNPGPPQAAPPGMPSVNPPAVGPGYPTGMACEQLHFAGTVANTGVDTLTARQPLPSGVTLATIDATFDDAAAVCSPGLALYLMFSNAAGTALSPTQACGSGSPAVHHSGNGAGGQSGAIPAGATHFQWGTRNTNCAAPIPYTADVNFYCGTAPGGGSGIVPQPCPPDPIVQGMLSQLLTLVTLIQRQAVPFAYVPGTLHNGLSGSGQLSVTGLIGAKITITATTPGAVGVQTGDPEFLWQAGWINWGSADGWSPREFLSATSTVSLPASAGAYTLLGYSLPPGVTVSILELRREP